MSIGQSSRLLFAAISALVIGAAVAPLCAPSAAIAADKRDGMVAAATLGRGVNILGYDPIWKDPSKARFRPHYYKMLQDSGFQTVRVNLHAFAFMKDDGMLDPQWLDTLDSVVDQATKAGLNVILDEHDYRFCQDDAVQCRTKLLSFWDQIGTRYKGAPKNVFFEILNEPHGALTPEIWNALLAEALTVMRKTNPQRNVIVGPANSNSFRSLDTLSLPPDDHHLIVTVHYYDPFPFTHQGATWTTPSRKDMLGVHWGNDAERAAIERDFATIAAWGKAHDQPILLGEFGAYDKGDMASRQAWTAAVARSAENEGFAWCYWQFDNDFTLYRTDRQEWVEPIYSALIPGRKPAP
jgi:endoglucanase